ncbi:hypothetical protein HCN44_007372 [Aphidius gifuensis]|uniref:Fibronectin type-III domain-containing protein n=1 Tax=Aphidius gifuensis TaxID=684658 RepID=A0A834XP26_APHGI|nr:hypothetical protein HCN44_007372 [Aphidius gifuensis]
MKVLFIILIITTTFQVLKKIHAKNVINEILHVNVTFTSVLIDDEVEINIPKIPGSIIKCETTFTGIHKNITKLDLMNDTNTNLNNGLIFHKNKTTIIDTCSFKINKFPIEYFGLWNITTFYNYDTSRTNIEDKSTYIIAISDEKDNGDLIVSYNPQIIAEKDYMYLMETNIIDGNIKKCIAVQKINGTEIIYSTTVKNSHIDFRWSNNKCVLWILQFNETFSGTWKITGYYLKNKNLTQTIMRSTSIYNIYTKSVSLNTTKFEYKITKYLMDNHDEMKIYNLNDPAIQKIQDNKIRIRIDDSVEWYEWYIEEYSHDNYHIREAVFSVEVKDNIIDKLDTYDVYWLNGSHVRVTLDDYKNSYCEFESPDEIIYQRVNLNSQKMKFYKIATVDDEGTWTARYLLKKNTISLKENKYIIKVTHPNKIHIIIKTIENEFSIQYISNKKLSGCIIEFSESINLTEDYKLYICTIKSEKISEKHFKKYEFNLMENNDNINYKINVQKNIIGIDDELPFYNGIIYVKNGENIWVQCLYDDPLEKCTIEGPHGFKYEMKDPDKLAKGKCRMIIFETNESHEGNWYCKILSNGKNNQVVYVESVSSLKIIEENFITSNVLAYDEFFWQQENNYNNTNVNKKILTCKVPDKINIKFCKWTGPNYINITEKRVEKKYTAIVNSRNCSLHINDMDAEDFGEWYCYVYLEHQNNIIFDYSKMNLKLPQVLEDKNFKAYDYELLDVVVHNNAHLKYKPLNNSQKIRYCNWINPDGNYLFKNISTSKYQSQKNDNDCQMEIKDISENDFGSWTCCAILLNTKSDKLCGIIRIQAASNEIYKYIFLILKILGAIIGLFLVFAYDSNNSTVSDISRPEPPLNPTFETRKNETVIINWAPPFNTSYSGFHVEILPVNLTPDNSIISIDIPPQESYIIIKNLTAGETYKFKLYTILNSKKSLPITSKNLTTNPNKPGQSNVLFKNETTLHITWLSPFPFGIFSHYNISIAPSDATTSFYQLKNNKNTSSLNEAIFNNLIPGKLYKIIITTISNNKKSIPQILQQRTLPLMPTNLTINNITTESFKITWNPPNKLSQFDYYKITLLTDETTTTINQLKNESSWLFNNLKPGNTYCIKIQTISDDLSSLTLSKIITIKPLSIFDIKIKQPDDCECFEIDWNYNSSSIQDSVHVQINYLEIDDVIDVIDKQININNKKIIANDILPGRNYTIILKTMSKNIESNENIIYQISRPLCPMINQIVITKNLEISWKTDVNSRQQKFQIILIRNDTNTVLTKTTIETKLIIPNIYPGACYEIKIFSISYGINSKINNDFIIIPPRPPINLHLSKLWTFTSVFIRWIEPSKSLFSEFIVSYIASDNFEWIKLPAINTTELEISNLIPGEKYVIRVNTISYGVEGNYPAEIKHIIAPKPVTSVIVIPHYNNATLFIERPEGRIDYYIIEVSKLNENNVTKIVNVINFNATKIYPSIEIIGIDNLIPDEDYFISIFSVSHHVLGEATNWNTTTAKMPISELSSGCFYEIDKNKQNDTLNGDHIFLKYLNIKKIK